MLLEVTVILVAGIENHIHYNLATYTHCKIYIYIYIYILTISGSDGLEPKFV